MPAQALLSAPEGSIDLHSHTRFSDGTLTPAELVARAAAAGVRVLAVTDHDTLEGLAEAEAALPPGLQLLPGMEVSARHGAQSVHVLAYFPPGRAPSLPAFQDERRRARRERLVAMVARLAELGLAIDPATVLAAADADPRRTPGRPDLARALVAAGHVASVQEAFDRWLAEGKPAHVADRVPEAGDAIAMIHRLGGLAVVAHPALDQLEPHLGELARLGLDGVEAYHGAHEPAQAEALRARARELSLLCTGGSDFHGDPPPGVEGRGLGQVRLPAAEWERFVRALCPGGARGGAVREA